MKKFIIKSNIDNGYFRKIDNNAFTCFVARDRATEFDSYVDAERIVKTLQSLSLGEFSIQVKTADSKVPYLRVVGE